MPINQFKGFAKNTEYFNQSIRGSELLKFSTSNPALDAYYYPELINVKLKSPNWVFTCLANMNPANVSGSIHNFSLDIFTKDINKKLVPAYTNSYISMAAYVGATNPMYINTVVSDSSLSTVNINGTASTVLEFGAVGKQSTWDGMAVTPEFADMSGIYTSVTAGSQPIMTRSSVWPFFACEEIWIAFGYTKANTTIAANEILNLKFSMFQV